MSRDFPIVMVTHDFPPLSGGISRYLSDMCRWLPGSRLTVVAPSVLGSAAADGRQSFRVARVPGPAGNSGLARLGQVLAVYRWMYRHLPADARVVFGHFWLGLMTLLPGWKWRYAVVYYGGEWPRYSRPWLRRRLFARIARSGAACLAISRYTADECRRWCRPGQELHIFTPALDLSRFPSPVRLPWDRDPGDGLVLLTVARLDERKGHLRVIEALPQLRARHPGLRYRVVGSGQMRSALERRAVECGVADIVEFLGFVPDERLAGIYQSSDVFVLPSITSEQSTEGFGIVFLEAGLFGLPVVACRSGGVDDAVADFETGLLVSPGDAAELGGAVARLLDDRELRLRLGRQGRERVLRDFSWGTRRRGLIEVLDGM